METVNFEVAAQPAFEAQTIADAQGYERRLYSLGDQTVLFRGREELPTLPEDAGFDTAPALLTKDELPHQVDLNEFSEYVNSGSQPSTGQEKVMAVNATPVGIIDLALHLRERPDEELSNMRDNFLHGKIGARENALLDIMSAAVFVKDQEDSPVSTDGLLDVVLALNGDTKKRALLHERMKVLESQEEHLMIKEVGEDALGLVLDHQPVPPEVITEAKGLVLVRTTSNKPHVREDGSFEAAPVAHYTRDIHGQTDGQAYIPRQTTHFTMNHLVVSHPEGNFQNKDYVIVAPFDEALEANGRPHGIRAVDTYFLGGPNEQVVLPDAVLVFFSADQKELVKRQGQEVSLKAVDFSSEDVQFFKKMCEPAEFMVSQNDRTPDDILCNRLEKICNEADLEMPKGDVTNDSERVVEHIINSYPESADAVMGELLKGIVVDSLIIEQGGRLVTSDEQSVYIRQEDVEKQISGIARKLHVSQTLHAVNDVGRIEDLAFRRLFGGEIRTDGKYDWRALNGLSGHELNEYLASAECPQRVRRAMLESGLFTARGEYFKHQNELAAQQSEHEVLRDF